MVDNSHIKIKMYGSWDVKMNEILELKGIKKAFGGMPVLNGIDLSVKDVYKRQI